MWGWYGLWVYKAIIKVNLNILLTSLLAPTPEDTLPAELRDISASVFRCSRHHIQSRDDLPLRADESQGQVYGLRRVSHKELDPWVSDAHDERGDAWPGVWYGS